MNRFVSRTALAMAAVLSLAACEKYTASNEPPPPGNLTRHFTMIGNDGKRYGTIELDPIRGGRMYDAQGQVIGTIITPAQ